MSYYISTTQFADYNPEVDVSQYTDTTLSGMITRACAEIDSFLGYTLNAENVSNEKSEGHINSDNSMVIFTKKRPINSVSEIKIVKGTYSATLDLTDGDGTPKYDIPANSNRILIPGQDITMQTVSIIDWGSLRSTEFFTLVSYNAGYSTIPYDIQDAVQLWVMDIISRKQNSTGATQIRQGGISMSFDSRKGESDLMKDAKAILSRYQRVAYIG